jgi:hypothetical protein
MAVTLNGLSPVTDLNRMVDLANKTKNLVNPEVFYSKQLLDTIRIDAKEFKYYKLATTSPIQEKADKLTVRRWAPLQAHTVPLVEGVPPKSDKGSVEKYELEANQYGRFMEFTDKVDFHVVDPVLAHYSKEYSIVAMETLDLLAREALFSNANPFYAGQVAKFDDLKLSSKPSMTDLRLIALHFKRALVKPFSGRNFKVICSPEFTYDMIEDPTVEKFMKINQTTKDAYDGSTLFPLFGMEFEESLCVPASGDVPVLQEDSSVVIGKRLIRETAIAGTYDYITVTPDTLLEGDTSAPGYSATGPKVCTQADGYVKDSRTGQDASYIPELKVWDIDKLNAKGSDNQFHKDWTEFKVHHVLVVGKDCLVRTGLTGEGNARMYVKQKGSAGVLDPIDQRQSIGFKINSVGFGTCRAEAIVDYMCVPSTANLVG